MRAGARDGISISFLKREATMKNGFYYAKFIRQSGRWTKTIVRVHDRKLWLFGQIQPIPIPSSGLLPSWLEILGPVPEFTGHEADTAPEEHDMDPKHDNQIKCSKCGEYDYNFNMVYNICRNCWLEEFV